VRERRPEYHRHDEEIPDHQYTPYLAAIRRAFASSLS
jgi:hypothetical protein